MNSLFKALPKSGQKYFHEVYAASRNRGSSVSVAEATAVEMVKKKLVRQDGMLIAMSEAFETPKLYTFELQTNDLNVVQNAETGELLIEGILADTTLNTEGQRFDSESLNEICEQINTFGSSNPDEDHEILDIAKKHLPELIMKHNHDKEKVKAEFAQIMNERKGVFKNIKGMVKDGKLWIQAVLDKRYTNTLKKYGKMSIEALAVDNGSGVLKKPKYIGFTFTDKPKLVGAQLTRVSKL